MAWTVLTAPPRRPLPGPCPSRILPPSPLAAAQRLQAFRLWLAGSWWGAQNGLSTSHVTQVITQSWQWTDGEGLSPRQEVGGTRGQRSCDAGLCHVSAPAAWALVRPVVTVSGTGPALPSASVPFQGPAAAGPCAGRAAAPSRPWWPCCPVQAAHPWDWAPAPAPRCASPTSAPRRRRCWCRG